MYAYLRPTNSICIYMQQKGKYIHIFFTKDDYLWQNFCLFKLIKGKYIRIF